MMTKHHISEVAGGLDAYEFYVEMTLFFRCDGCGTSLDCPVGERDTDAPSGGWMRFHAKRARDFGWYVHPLSPNGGLIAVCFCPACANGRKLIVQ
jgi:hypothetical protein